MGKTNNPTYKKVRGLHITSLMSRDGSDCTLCGLPLNRHIKDERDPLYVTFDHIVPVSLGGQDELSNLQLAHRACNQVRGNAEIEKEG